MERQREIERQGRLHAGRPPRLPKRPVRKAIGRALIRIGYLLAVDDRLAKPETRT
jgi:hypothetical protein